MTRITIFELFARGVPEGFLFVLAVHALSRKKIQVATYVITSLVIILTTYFIRNLNVGFGVHTILNIITLITFCIFICKIDLYNAVKGTMIATFFMFSFEMINVLLIYLFVDESIQIIVEDPVKKTIAGLPGIFMFALTVLPGYFFMTRNSLSTEFLLQKRKKE